MEKQTILLVEDEEEIQRGIRDPAFREVLHLRPRPTACGADEQPDRSGHPLDVMMPGMSGLRVCEEIRKTSTMPILFLTATAQESDKMIGLTAGGDDYLTKPFSFAELSARVKALLRRYCVYQGKGQPGTTYDNNTLTCCGVTLALDHNQVWVGEEEKDLTEIEYQILRLLMQSPQQVFSAQRIYENIWQEPYFPISNGTVMVHIRKLRLKLETDPQRPTYIKTIWGKGYRFGWEANYDAQK